MSISTLDILFYLPCMWQMGSIFMDEKTRRKNGWLMVAGLFGWLVIHYFYSILSFLFAWMAANTDAALAYDNLDAFKLILCCSEGTKYEGLVHEMVEIEIEATRAFGKTLEGLGMPAYRIDPQLEHMLISGFLTAAFETIIHDMPRDKAMEYIRELRVFHTAGWKEIMGF